MEIQPHNKVLFVSLGSQMDRFKLSQFSTNAQIEELRKPNELVYFQVKNLETASKLCKNFISEFNLSSSNWIGGRIIDSNNNFVARISYNGRIWNDEGF